jgi:hypothetical protein
MSQNNEVRRTVCPESTLESANRRHFIKKAAAVTAAAGIGTSLIDKGLIPESNARSACFCTFCYVNVSDCVLVGVSKSCVPFTGKCTQAVYVANNSGCSKNTFRIDGDDNTLFIAAHSKCGAVAGAGLTFRTGAAGAGEANRMRITPCGFVGIGTCTPSANLCVKGVVAVCGTLLALSSGLTICASSTQGNAVQARSDLGTGVVGSGNPIGVQAMGTTPKSVPLVVQGFNCQVSDLQQWQLGCQTIGVVTHNGSIGIGVVSPQRKLCVSGKIHASCGLGLGTQTINTTLAVNGSVAGKARIATTSAEGTMGASDFALLANGAITVTLAPAKTQVGMMAFVKNISSSAVTVKPSGTDKVEGSTASISLGKLGAANSGLIFISDGVSNWYVLSSAAT